MQRRKSLGKLPLQANFYPVPTMMFLQDKKKRLTLQTQQTNGGASLEQGKKAVVLATKWGQALLFLGPETYFGPWQISVIEPFCVKVCV